MISTSDIERLAGILEAMSRLELSIAEFYRTCAVASKDDEAFWMTLAHAEIRHASTIDRIRALLTEKQERFEAGRPFNAVAIKTTISGIEASTARVAQGGMTRDRLLLQARDIEQSILESRYAEIIKSGDVEYQTLMKEIIAQTSEHKKMIQNAIDAVTR